ncbi:MAG: histone deacetylase [Dethiobacter sp.]|jgi:acetoin utilization deacetylase AcuC-like enzyme|nr:MAG: histone deacetylase [Dethiobacter sp.]
MEKAKTGIVYHDDFLLHTNFYHPECKERLEAAMEKLREKKVLQLLEIVVPLEKASEETIALVHREDYIKDVENACQSGSRQLDMDTYLTPDTYEVARLAVRGGLDAVDKVMGGELDRVFALLRPPGHHAEPNRGMGFCIFNNIAIASRYLQKKYGLKRIMIVDWDVHHGNSTQHIFEEEAGVLFFSVHQSPAYPGTGGVREVGRRDGVGYTINAPMPAGCGDEDYLKLFNEIVLPVMDEYKPEMLLVSAGQDAYRGDPLASMNLSLQCYAHLAKLLVKGAEKNTGGKMIFFLEGGYNVDAQASIIYNVLNVISRWNLPLEEDSEIHRSRDGAEAIEAVRAFHKQYWKALQ